MGARQSRAERARRAEHKEQVFRDAERRVQESAAAGGDNFSPELARIRYQQLGRRGAPFVKADLIGILVRMTDFPHERIYQLQHNTCDDLRAMIRLAIFDPQHETLRPRAELDGSRGQTKQAPLLSLQTHTTTTT